MANLRNAMLVAALAATAIAAIAGFFLGGPPSRLLVDAGLAAALAIIVVVMLTPTVNRVDALVEALRALARGDRGQRVNVDDFAGLSEVARAMNEVAASLTESDDPNLGPVKSQPHPTFRTRPTSAHKVIDDDIELSDHPELGRVRVLKKKDQPQETTMGEAISEALAVGRAKKSQPPATTPAPRDVDKPAKSTTDLGRPERAAPSNDTAIDEAPRSDIRSGESAVPSREELEALFQEFVAAKKSHDENVADLDLDAFAQTIQGECERLITAHQCKGVRFEVTTQDGEVSLRPRLLR